MPSQVMMSLYAVMSIILMLLSEPGQAMLETRLVTSGPAPLGFAGPLAIGLTSWAGWALSFAILRIGRWGRLYLPLTVHPATVLLTIGGYGMAVAALLAVFISIERVMVSRSTSTVPALGLALGGAALAVPGFRMMFVAFAAPLVLVLPKAMLERNVLAFYLVSLLPALSIMAIGLVFGPQELARLPTGSPVPLIPVALAIPAAGLAVSLLHNWRLGTALGVISMGGFMAGTGSLLWPSALACLAAAFALHRTRSLAAEIGFAGAVVVAAALLARHI